MPTGAQEASPASTGDRTPSGGGDHPQKSAEQLVKEYQDETKRKQEIIEKMRERESERDEELAALREQMNELTERVSQPKDDDAKVQIKQNPKFKPWLEVHKEVAQEAAQEARWQESYDSSMDWIEDKASELKIEKKQFESEILDTLRGKWTDQMPHKRIKLAFKEWQEKKELDAKIKELEDLKAGKKLPPKVEGSGEQLTGQNLRDEFDKAKKGGNLSGVLKKIADSQTNLYSR